MEIVVKNLNYCYNKGNKNAFVKALDNVSLEIKEGDYFGIIGQTGSGKSTFVCHLNGLIKPESGSVLVGDFDLTEKKCDFKKLRSKVGMVFQYPEYQLFAETVEADVRFGLDNFFPELSISEKADMVKTAIETVGLNYYEVKDKSPFELSGGQKRRVAIAGVIVTRPEVLVLDEPAAGLDPSGKREFLALLKKLHNDFVKTIIIVSHDMNLVSENCNKVAVFKDGKVVKTGTPKEVYSDLDVINSCALELPTTAFLTQNLQQKHTDFDNDYTVKDFVKSVCDKWGKV